ncbi:hypothetical protein J6590_071382 [Homalodisca vitripennis]|nr:hypothetical protein J6590_071382 [Homalodisca vitripennis]
MQDGRQTSNHSPRRVTITSGTVYLGSVLSYHRTPLRSAPTAVCRSQSGADLPLCSAQSSTGSLHHLTSAHRPHL